MERPHAHVWDISHQFKLQANKQRNLCRSIFIFKICDLLGYLWLKMVIRHQRFGTAYRFHLQIERTPSCWISRPVKMGPIGCPETSVWNNHSVLCNNHSVLCNNHSVLCNNHSVLCNNHSVLCNNHSVLCNNPEQCRPHVHRGRSCKSLIYLNQ